MQHDTAMTIKLDNGEATTSHSPRMVNLATKWLEEYFSDGKARTPGDLEDDFTGRWSLLQEPWRDTPFYPALAVLVKGGKVVYGTDADGSYWYAKKGHLPSEVTEDSEQ